MLVGEKTTADVTKLKLLREAVCLTLPVRATLSGQSVSHLLLAFKEQMCDRLQETSSRINFSMAALKGKWRKSEAAELQKELRNICTVTGCKTDFKYFSTMCCRDTTAAAPEEATRWLM